VEPSADENIESKKIRTLFAVQFARKHFFSWQEATMSQPVLVTPSDAAYTFFNHVWSQDNVVLVLYKNDTWNFLTKKNAKELSEKHFTREQIERFSAAKKAEVDSLVNCGAIEVVDDQKELARLRGQMAGRIVPSRFVLTEKQGEVGEPTKAKARWILLGHRDPDRYKVERYSPTPATVTLYLALYIMSSLHYVVNIMDVKTAFGQSDQVERPEGPLYGDMPPGGVPGYPENFLFRILTAVYGLCNAPAVWRQTIRRILLELTYKESSFDPCLFYLPYNQAERERMPLGMGCAGVVLLDVDDFAQGGNDRHAKLMEELKKHLKFGKWVQIYNSSADYIGRTLSQKQDYEVTISMQRYAEEKLQPVLLSRH